MNSILPGIFLKYIRTIDSTMACPWWWKVSFVSSKLFAIAVFTAALLFLISLRTNYFQMNSKKCLTNISSELSWRKHKRQNDNYIENIFKCSLFRRLITIILVTAGTTWPQWGIVIHDFNLICQQNLSLIDNQPFQFTRHIFMRKVG